MDCQVWDIKVWDIIEIYLPSFDGYRGRAEVTWVGDRLTSYPIKVTYIDSFMYCWINRCWFHTAVKYSEITWVISNDKKVLEQDFKFIKL